MAYTTSTDAIEICRGLEEKIKNERTTPIANGHIYFATDTDKLFYDANGVRHEISGGGDVSFISALVAPEYNGETGEYVFNRSDIVATKLAVDNIILAPVADNAIYRIIAIEDDIVRTKQIAGGGGGGGGFVNNPLSMVFEEHFPERVIDSQDITCVMRVSSINQADQNCKLQIFVNNVEVPSLGRVRFELRHNTEITIPHQYYSLSGGMNEVKFVATLDSYTLEKFEWFTPFHSEFTITDFNSRLPYGTDSAVNNTLTIGYGFTGLDYIAGHIHMDIDGQELFDLTNTSDIKVVQAGGGLIHGPAGTLRIPCTNENFAEVKHGNHTLTLRAYAVVDNVEYYVNSISYDIIWATAAGGDIPIIIADYPEESQVENYNIISIPYLIYAKNVDIIVTRLYANGDELPTSPINYERTGANTWSIWTISKYLPNYTNHFMMIANVRGQLATRQFAIEITESDLKLDPVEDSLLLYLSAQDRSNKESTLSRQTWTYGDPIPDVEEGQDDGVVRAQLSGFNWYNNGWQFDDNGDNVLRLNNGATVFIPFKKALQVDMPSTGFTIEAEFRCRNATSFAKLLTYSPKKIQDTDEFGHLLYEQEIVYEEDGITPKTKIKMILDKYGNETDEPEPEVDALGHKAYKCDVGEDEDTHERVYETLYAHEAEDGTITYWTKKNKQYTDTIYSTEPIYATEIVMRNKKIDPEGPDDKTNWTAIMLEDGGVTKSINYVMDANGQPTDQVANAVGTFFGQHRGLCIGTQEAFFASRDVTVNVRYADNDKVKITVVADTGSRLLYIYINAVLSGVEPFSSEDSFATGSNGLMFNSDYCDLDIYTIRVYDRALNFAEVVKNWIGDAPNLQEKRQRYLENTITKVDERNGYVTLDYKLTKELSRKMAENYKKQVELGLNTKDVQKGLPICVISTYPKHLSHDALSDLLPYNKSIKQYVDIRFWDPNGDVQSFKAQDFELSVQGTSSQGYPRRNYKAKLSETDPSKNAYANRYPFYWTTWDGDDDPQYKDRWPEFNFPDAPESDATPEEIEAYEEAYAAAEEEGWNEYKRLTQKVTEDGVTQGYKQLEKIDIGNGTKEKNFCFKADYMDSSSAHNTSLANYVAELSKYTPALAYPIKSWATNPGEWRQTVYGFPMLVFWDHKGQSTDPEFVGRYNFNTDKSAKGSFGFQVKENHKYLHDVDYYTVEEQIDSKGKKKDVTVKKHGTPKYKDACECWELTSNQHGFTGFRRNDFYATDADGKADFYNFFENRYHGANFNIDDMYADSDDITATNEQAFEYAKNIIDLSRWIYSTDVHPWDGEGSQDYDPTDVIHHKFTKLRDNAEIKFEVLDDSDENNITFRLLRDYYVINGTKCTQITADQFKITKEVINDQPVYTAKVYAKVNDTVDFNNEIFAASLSSDEINAVLDTPKFYLTRDSEFQVEWIEGSNEPNVIKDYYTSADESSRIDHSWYKRKQILKTDPISGNEVLIGYTTEVESPQGVQYPINRVYEEYTRDTKAYRLSKYRAEFSKHLNFAYCAFYFILTEFFLLYDSREKNMMILSWGPEEPIDLEHPEEGGQYIWYPIFYDMDTQLGINNSGVVYWDYDVNAQDDGIFSGAGSVLWDNFYACFLEEIKVFYRNLRSQGHFNLDGCEQYYNEESANRWTPIMKNIDAFYKYVAPSINADGLRYITKQGKEGLTDVFFYCAQGDRTLNRSAFFRNRFNYKDSEWLGGAYQTQGSQCISMRYDANWTGTSDPQASDFSLPNTLTEEQKNEIKASLQAEASFDIKPYLTQYCSVYYDEIAREGGRYDIQHEPRVNNAGVATESTKLDYPHNWQNIKKNGYITVTPVPAIQEAIDSGMALSQQLVYIYGPEYLRDMGDLSLKYLDQFYAESAIRLNRLVLGNDNPYYKNNGMSSALKLSAHYSDVDQTTGKVTLNPNMKALLQYLDLSNLSELKGGLNISGCLKLNTMKARGTGLTNVTLPEGNVVETLYLPATLEAFVQIQSQKLNTVIRQASLASKYEQAKLNREQAQGLYIENITDRMNISNDTDIYSKYTAPGDEASHAEAINYNLIHDPNYNNSEPTASTYMTSIDTFRVEGGKLGFISYELLDYILKQKIKSRYDSGNINSKPQLKLRLLDLVWTPYEKLDPQATDDRTFLGTTYYIRTDDLRYEELDSSITFEYANKNLGGVYRKTDNRLSANGADQNTAPLEGLPNLDMLEMFISDYNHPKRTNSPRTENGESYYLVRDISVPSDLSKRLPHLSGEIYVANDAQHPIDEYKLYEMANTFTAALDPGDNPLIIRAAYTNECPRAKFIVISLGTGRIDSDGIRANGEQTILDIQRSDSANASVTLPELIDLTRNSYDFRGWATYDAISEYQSDFLVINEHGVVESNSGGVVPTNSPLLSHLAVKMENNNPVFEDGNSLKFGDTPKTYYAVYTLHKYDVRYVLDIPKYTNSNGQDPTSYELVPVPSGANISEYLPAHIPYYANDTLPVGKMHKFIGWAVDLTQANDGRTRTMDFTINENRVFYPVYTIINNVWTDEAAPLSADCFKYVKVNGEIYIYGTTRTLGGRICIPSSINGSPVTRIYGSSWVVQASAFTGPVTVDQTNGISTNGESNGFQDNWEIEHIYFQGASPSNDTSSIRYFCNSCFGRMLKLTYIDFPDSLEAIEQRVFMQCSNLSFRDLNNVTQIGDNAFLMVNTMVTDPTEADTSALVYKDGHEPELRIRAGVSLGRLCLNQSGWERVYLGDPTNPYTYALSTGNVIHAGMAQCQYVNEQGQLSSRSLGSKTIEQIYLYSSVETISDYNSGGLSNNSVARNGTTQIIVNNEE